VRRGAPEDLTRVETIFFAVPGLDRAQAHPKTPHVSRTGQAWVEDLQRGPGAAHDRAVAELRDFVRRALGRGFGSRLNDGELDDLTQESLLRVIERLHTFQERSRFTTWPSPSPSIARTRSSGGGVTDT